jgi:predicted HAD superfamily Cof-like phosphohydrolase
MSVFKDVEEFMVAAGQSTTTPNLKQAELYEKLIKEEYEEFLEARKNFDNVETADACFDMMWVIVGYMLSRGWNPNKIWDEGALSNLRKIDPATKKVLKREDGKVMKPENWQAPDFSKFV